MGRMRKLCQANRWQVQPSSSTSWTKASCDPVLSLVGCFLVLPLQRQRWEPEWGPSSWLLSFYRGGQRGGRERKYISTWGFEVVYLGESCHLFPSYFFFFWPFGIGFISLSIMPWRSIRLVVCIIFPSCCERTHTESATNSIPYHTCNRTFTHQNVF